MIRSENRPKNDITFKKRVSYLLLRTADAFQKYIKTDEMVEHG